MQQAGVPQYIVGIGASAGGLDAFTEFLKRVSPQTGMAFVVLQHLSPDYPSELPRILQASTSMNVQQVTDAPELEANTVYVIPPGKLMSARDGHLELREPSGIERRSLIDHFFRTLAEEQGERAVCIVFSGMGADGAIGLKRVKEAGGITMAQAPSDAQFDSMPRAAISTGLVDFVGSVSELVEVLEQLPQHAQDFTIGGDGEAEAEVLQRLFVQLRMRTGYDFSGYKRSTILRRIKRRMQVVQFDALSDYLEYVRAHDGEAALLVKDFLISVTNFFRDPDVFEALSSQVIPRLFERHPGRDPVRVWVPGCATGEEAYSLAMLLHEHRDQTGRENEIQIFATDIDTEALAVAREGLYPPPIAGDVSPERLQRFFREQGSGTYRVSGELSDSVLFAQHNVLKDPPFSRIDLISCRNLLIYFTKELQQRVFELFHYALVESGFLLLGSSESAETSRDLFRVIDKPQRLYVRQGGIDRLPRLMTTSLPSKPARPVQAARSSDQSFGRLHQAIILERFAPPSVLVNREYEVRHYQGDVGQVLRPASGVPSHQLLQMVDPSLRLELRTALFQAFRTGDPVEVLVKHEDGSALRLCVLPVRASGKQAEEELAVVMFEPHEVEAAGTRAVETSEKPAFDEQLAEEIERMKLRLQTTIEEYETSSEELRASNEELQSMNEEARSMAEELETSKEELQSTNEELVTVNQELSSKIEELARANSDLENLMHATDIGTLFLDRNLTLKRYTPRVTELFNIIASDLGRPFEHVSHKIEYDGLAQDARRVLERLEPIRSEVKSKQGNWFLVHILPYRTPEDRIDGVVLTFVDITDRKALEAEERHRAHQQRLVAEIGEYALRAASFQDLLDMAVRQVAQGLDVPLAKVLRFEPEHRHLVLVAGVGWQEGLVGTATVEAGRHSQAGFTLANDYPIIVKNLAAERRFTGPPLLTDHDVTSGISVVIHGPDAHPYGVLGAHAPEARDLGERDAAFMQSVANVLGSAVRRYEVERELRLTTDRFRTALAGAPITVFNQDADHRYTWIYQPVQYPEADIVGKDDFDLFERREDAEHIHALKQRVLDTGERATEEFHAYFGGAERVFILNVEPCIENGEIVGTMSAAFEVTELKRTEEALRTLTEDLERRVAARTHEVHQRAEQVRALASELTLAEQRERHRVAQILHDDLQQLLYSLQIKKAMLARHLGEAPEAVREQLDTFDGLLLRAIATTRNLTVDLSPPVLSGEGLLQALEWLAVQMSELHELEVALHAENLEGRVASHDLQVLLFQLVRELLFNVVKHAGVKTAEVLLSEQAGTLTIRVRDGGAGFDPEALADHKQVEGGFGLYSIRERLPLFGGHLTITSAVGEGTEATISIPIVPPGENPASGWG